MANQEIMPQGSKREQGRQVQRANIAMGKMIGDLVRTTLGPKGMDKLLMDALGDVTVTNDGVTILRELQAEHPAAKMIIEIAKTQESEVGDGTTTAVVIAGEMLKRAEELLDEGIHPTVIAKGYKMAAKKGIEILEANSYDIEPGDLKKIAMTAMTGKGTDYTKEMFAELVIKAVRDVQDNENSEIDLTDIKVECKAGGTEEESEVIKGIAIDLVPAVRCCEQLRVYQATLDQQPI